MDWVSEGLAIWSILDCANRDTQAHRDLSEREWEILSLFNFFSPTTILLLLLSHTIRRHALQTVWLHYTNYLTVIQKIHSDHKPNYPPINVPEGVDTILIPTNINQLHWILAVAVQGHLKLPEPDFMDLQWRIPTQQTSLIWGSLFLRNI